MQALKGTGQTYLQLSNYSHALGSGKVGRYILAISLLYPKILNGNVACIDNLLIPVSSPKPLAYLMAVPGLYQGKPEDV